MKVIEGAFGKEADDRKPMDILREQLERDELDSLEEAVYLLLVDTGDQLMMVSNMCEAGDVAMLMEKSKVALIMSELGTPLGIEGGSA